MTDAPGPCTRNHCFFPLLLVISFTVCRQIDPPSRTCSDGYQVSTNSSGQLPEMVAAACKDCDSAISQSYTNYSLTWQGCCRRVARQRLRQVLTVEVVLSPNLLGEPHTAPHEHNKLSRQFLTLTSNKNFGNNKAVTSRLCLVDE